jgi:hypothetical protein
LQKLCCSDPPKPSELRMCVSGRGEESLASQLYSADVT